MCNRGSTMPLGTVSPAYFPVDDKVATMSRFEADGSATGDSAVLPITVGDAATKPTLWKLTAAADTGEVCIMHTNGVGEWQALRATHATLDEAPAASGEGADGASDSGSSAPRVESAGASGAPRVESVAAPSGDANEALMWFARSHGTGVWSFESAAVPNYYLTAAPDNTLTLAQGLESSALLPVCSWPSVATQLQEREKQGAGAGDVSVAVGAKKTGDTNHLPWGSRVVVSGQGTETATFRQEGLVQRPDEWNGHLTVHPSFCASGLVLAAKADGSRLMLKAVPNIKVFASSPTAPNGPVVGLLSNRRQAGETVYGGRTFANFEGAPFPSWVILDLGKPVSVHRVEVTAFVADESPKRLRIDVSAAPDPHDGDGDVLRPAGGGAAFMAQPDPPVWVSATGTEDGELAVDQKWGTLRAPEPSVMLRWWELRVDGKRRFIRLAFVETFNGSQPTIEFVRVFSSAADLR